MVDYNLPLPAGIPNDNTNTLPPLTPQADLPLPADIPMTTVNNLPPLEGNLPETSATTSNPFLSRIRRGLDEVRGFLTAPFRSNRPDTQTAPGDVQTTSEVPHTSFTSGFEQGIVDDGIPTWNPYASEGTVENDLGMGGYIRQGYTAQGISPEDAQKISEAQNIYNTLVGYVAELDSVIGVNEAAGLNQAVSQYIEATSDDHNSFVKGVTEITKRLDNVTKEMHQLASQSIDPDRYIKNMPGTQKALSVLTAFAEGFGGKNVDETFSMRYLQSKIQQDIALQERDINSKKEGLNFVGNALKEKLNILGSMDAAKQSMNLTLLEATKQKIDALSMGANAQISPDKAQLMIAGIEVEQAKLFAETQKSEYINAAMLQGQEDPLAKIDWSRSVNLPDGTVGIVTSPKEAQEFNALSARVSTFNKTAEEAKQLREELVNSSAILAPSILSAKKQYLKQLTTQMHAQLAPLADVASSKEGQKLLRNLISDQTGMSYAISDVNNVQKMLNNNVQDSWNQVGVGIAGTQEQVRPYRLQRNSSN
jgi:hypothetical protein